MYLAMHNDGIRQDVKEEKQKKRYISRAYNFLVKFSLCTKHDLLQSKQKMLGKGDKYIFK